MGFLERLRAGLSKTRERLFRAIPWSAPPEEVLEELEAALLAADVGLEATEALLEELRASGQKNLKETLKEKLALMLEPDPRRATLRRLGFHPQAPRMALPQGPILLLVGVNGAGKTTTAAKLGWLYQKEGLRVLLGAADTFRAAGAAQLAEWGARLGLPVLPASPGADPAAFAYDAAMARKARGYDLLILDTAGRLHTKQNLMEELKRVKRALDKAEPGESKEVWLVLDAVVGQNGLEQAKRFHEALRLTGVVVTKLDGTAKGGVLVPIVRTLGVPIRFVGVGEGPEDLQPFDPQAFAEALLE